MKKLKTKIFFTIVLILSISILSFIVVFNIQNYYNQKKSLENILEMSKNQEKKELPKENKDYENIKFIDYTIYTILLDENNNIKDVINHSNNDLTDNEIEILGNTILNKNPLNKHIGFLYFDKYSYEYSKYESLTIVDNSFIQDNLYNYLKQSIFIFIILELITIFISKIITSWLVKPVKESFDKQKQFIQDASHELKTPLSIIMTSSEMLKQNPKETKWLKNIEYETERINLLVTNLLELSKMEEKKNFLFKESDLSKIVLLSILPFEGIAYEKKIELKYDIQEDLKLKIDEDSIKQLVEILIDNAVHHAKEKIFINLSKENNNIKLTVENDGDLISKEDEEKIFERFYRTDKSRNRKESRYGLGLAIARNIVNNHNGKISASSSSDITTFKIIFKI